jgi:L-glutamine-phosphate cytidylyltransferase
MNKAIILSAGQGSRLGHLTDDRPKCLIEFGGRTLLDRQLDALAANAVGQAVVVTGFRDDLVEEALAKRSGGPDVRTIYNPFYKVADNLGSIFMAREELAGDCLVWNGDTLVSDSLMALVVGNDRPGICVTIDRKDSYDDDDMKVVVDGDGRLKAIGKRIPKGVNGESIGLLAFRARGLGALPRGHRAGHAHQRGDDHLVFAGDPPHRRTVRGVDPRHHGEEWGEVDFPEDVERAQALVAGWEAARKAA